MWASAPPTGCSCRPGTSRRAMVPLCCCCPAPVPPSTAVLPQAAVLARHGYGALLLDTRGHGRSGGHAMDFGWWGGRDIAASVSFLARQPGVQPGKIAVAWESMGGEQALVAARADPRIRAVVAEGRHRPAAR